MMNRTVIQKQKDVAAFVTSEQKFQEGDEVCASLAFGQENVETTGAGIEPAEDRHFFVLPGGVDDRLLTDARPDFAQAGVEVELAFVLIDKGVSIRLGDAFFNAASRSRRARRMSLPFCLCFRLSLGRLWR